MNWKLPNQLTVARIVLALGFFALLAFYEQGTAWGVSLLNVAFVVFLIAGITDILDGYLARKWNATSAFGRMVDPIVDKVLVVGAFVMLTGSNFSHAVAPAGAVSAFEKSLPQWLTGGMFSSVQAWMVVSILVRELIVSGVRGYSESRGQVFPATSGGKIKMLVQSVAVCAVLYQMANLGHASWAIRCKIAITWLAVIVTVVTGAMYLGKARRLLVSDE